MPTLSRISAEVIWLDVDETVGTLCRLAFQTLRDALEKLCAVEEQHGRITFECIVNQLGWFFGHLELWCYPDLHTWTIFEVDPTEFQVQFLCIAGVNMCLDDELLIFLPFARNRRDQRTFERCLAFWFEVVHDRQADQFVLSL